MAKFEAAELIGIANPLVVAVDAGGTCTRVAVGGETIARGNVTRFTTPLDLAEHTEQLGQAIMGLTDGRKPDIIGYGLAGETSPDGLTIIKGGAFSERGWLQAPIAAMTADNLNLETSRVRLINDLVTAGLAQRAADMRQMNVTLPSDYAGLVTGISTGTNSALYSEQGAVNLESGHWPTARRAEHACPCGQDNDAEAWLGGKAIQQRFGVPGKDLPAADPRWNDYRHSLGQVTAEQLAEFTAIAGESGLSIKKLSLFGSVAMGNSGAVEYLREHLSIPVSPATYGEDSGLYGAYFGARDFLAAI